MNEISLEDAVKVCGLIDPIKGTAQFTIKKHLENLSAQAAKYRACVEAARKYLKIISNNTKGAYLNHNHIDIQIALDELRAALAGLEG